MMRKSINKEENMSKHVNYEDWLNERLKDSKAIRGYLNAVLDDFKPDDKDSIDILIIALKDVIRRLE